ncbi:hypothetical protein VPNG_05099 [Cytospora leucostoma]|uniref:Uncharacterized protein n=1 Tax=Cytospora leucostoma TaxID=1230097 RepID=A0A423X461_9PEZI|nr:hypothetical protein VPNG_05099 [Cytospora leucostoma]
MDNTTQDSHSGGSPPEDRALADSRTQVFVREATRDGNTLVGLPDQTADVETSRQDNRQRVGKKIEAFEKKFNP